MRGVARVEATRVRPQRARVSVRIHLFVVVVVIAHGISTQLGVVALRGQHQRGAAAPAAHELRGEQLLSFGCVGVLAQVVAERADVLLKPPVGHVAAVARQHLGLRQISGRPVFVGIAQDELAGFQRRSRARRRLLTGSLHHRLRQPVSEAEVVVGVVKRRRRVQVEDRQAPHPVAPSDVLVVHGGSAPVFGVRAREQDRDRV